MTIHRIKLRHLAALMALAWATSASAKESNAFSTEQQTQIGQIAESYLTAHPDKMGQAISTYLADHPEFLIAASESLRQRQQVAQQQAYTQMALEYRDDLLSTQSPSVGPKTAKVAVVMFFDYQCSWCSKMAPVVEQVIKANPDVRFVFKELPIFASRWPVSGLAARVGEQVWLGKGGEAYLQWHNALYATGKVEGSMTEQDVYTLAQHYLTTGQLDAVKHMQENGPIHDALLANQGLANHMNFGGTPDFVIMPQGDNPDVQRITVIPGSTTQDMLLMAIQKAKG
ncbi:DsbA family protein [Pseudocitrobacter cyperus]|uniref:DsbA family protein n=1 Tax=Pseudocitrobacter cyperus TaxID=3112843 RepID=A0ABV0HIH5_9ENTR